MPSSEHGEPYIAAIKLPEGCVAECSILVVS